MSTLAAVQQAARFQLQALSPADLQTLFGAGGRSIVMKAGQTSITLEGAASWSGLQRYMQRTRTTRSSYGRFFVDFTVIFPSLPSHLQLAAVKQNAGFTQ